MACRLRMIDLYCGAGGCSVGYARAAAALGIELEVVGVDLSPQPRYPHTFIQGDALAIGAELVAQGVDVIHASPPCQLHSSLGRQNRDRNPDLVHDDLIPATRRLLEAAGVPYVIENVPRAPIRPDAILCGSMFGLGATCRDGDWHQLRRHRWFETNWSVGLSAPCAHTGRPVGVYGHGGGGQQRRGLKATLSEAREAMGIDWMDRREISQAIPPAYTEHLGLQLFA